MTLPKPPALAVWIKTHGIRETNDPRFEDRDH